MSLASPRLLKSCLEKILGQLNSFFFVQRLSLREENSYITGSRWAHYSPDKLVITQKEDPKKLKGKNEESVIGTSSSSFMENELEYTYWNLRKSEKFWMHKRSTCDGLIPLSQTQDFTFSPSRFVLETFLNPLVHLHLTCELWHWNLISTITMKKKIHFANWCRLEWRLGSVSNLAFERFRLQFEESGSNYLTSQNDLSRQFGMTSHNSKWI